MRLYATIILNTAVIPPFLRKEGYNFRTVYVRRRQGSNNDLMRIFRLKKRPIKVLASISHPSCLNIPPLSPSNPLILQHKMGGDCRILQGRFLFHLHVGICGGLCSSILLPLRRNRCFTPIEIL